MDGLRDKPTLVYLNALNHLYTNGLTFIPSSSLHIGVILFFCTVLSVEDKLKGILRKDTNAAHPDTKNAF